MKVEIRSPCPVNWKESERCGTSRFCHQCSLKVYNLSHMTEPDAMKVVARKRGGERLCVSFLRDGAGNVLFRSAAAIALAAAGLLQAQVAIADGSTAILAPIDPLAPAAAVVPVAAETPFVANTDAPVVVNSEIPVDPLAPVDIIDSNCAKNAPVRTAVNAPEATGAAGQQAGTDPGTEQLEWLEGDII